MTRGIPRFLCLAPLAYLLGLAAYWAIFWVVWRQETGDGPAVAFFGGQAFLLVQLPLSVIFFSLADRVTKAASRLTNLWVLLMMSTVIAVTPVAFISIGFGAGLAGIARPEGQLFYAFFLTAGLTLALAWNFMRGRGSHAKNPPRA